MNTLHPDWRLIDTRWLGPTFRDALHFAGQLYQCCEYYGEVRVLLRFVDVQDSTISVSSQRFAENELEDGIDTTSIQLFDQPELALKGIMDRLRNAFGLYESDYFDDQGRLSQR